MPDIDIHGDAPQHAADSRGMIFQGSWLGAGVPTRAPRFGVCEKISRGVEPLPDTGEGGRCVAHGHLLSTRRCYARRHNDVKAERNKEQALLGLVGRWIYTYGTPFRDAVRPSPSLACTSLPGRRRAQGIPY